MEYPMHQDPHYEFDEQSGLISLNTQHRFYKLERNVFLLKNIDIDSIKTFEEYCDYTTIFRYEIQAAFHEYIKNKKPKTIENKLTRSLILGENDEVERLDKLIDKIRGANLTVIK